MMEIKKGDPAPEFWRSTSLIASTCSICNSVETTVTSDAVICRFTVLPFSEAMSGPHIASATLKSCAVVQKLFPLLIPNPS